MIGRHQGARRPIPGARDERDQLLTVNLFAPEPDTPLGVAAAARFGPALGRFA
jgi:hypothetical protein